MTDIIERLRMPIGANPYTRGPVYNELRMQAADAIERLLAVVRAIDELPLKADFGKSARFSIAVL